MTTANTEGLSARLREHARQNGNVRLAAKVLLAADVESLPPPPQAASKAAPMSEIPADEKAVEDFEALLPWHLARANC